MVLPFGDDNCDRLSTPIVNDLLIGLNDLVFVVCEGLGANVQLTCKSATVPAEIKTGKDIVNDGRTVVDPTSGEEFPVPGLQPTPCWVYLIRLTSMFMHAGMAHLLGNIVAGVLLARRFRMGQAAPGNFGHVRSMRR